MDSWFDSSSNASSGWNLVIACTKTFHASNHVEILLIFCFMHPWEGTAIFGLLPSPELSVR